MARWKQLLGRRRQRWRHHRLRRQQLLRLPGVYLAKALSCGATITGSNSGARRTTTLLLRLEQPGPGRCCRHHAGPERRRRDHVGSVRGPRLFVTTGGAGSCDPTGCLDVGGIEGTGDETVTWTPAAPPTTSSRTATRGAAASLSANCATGSGGGLRGRLRRRRRRQMTAPIRTADDELHRSSSGRTPTAWTTTSTANRPPTRTVSVTRPAARPARPAVPCNSTVSSSAGGTNQVDNSPAPTGRTRTGGGH